MVILLHMTEFLDLKNALIPRTPSYDIWKQIYVCFLFRWRPSSPHFWEGPPSSFCSAPSNHIKTTLKPCSPENGYGTPKYRVCKHIFLYSFILNWCALFPNWLILFVAILQLRQLCARGLCTVCGHPIIPPVACMINVCGCLSLLAVIKVQGYNPDNDIGVGTPLMFIHKRKQ